MKNPSPDEYCVRLIDLPTTVKAMVAYSEDGFANVYVNAHLSRDEQRRAIRHELAHIARDDVYNSKTIREAEDTASEMA